MLNTSRLAGGAAVAFALQVTGAGLAYVSQVALARWMGTSSFGVYVYALAWATLGGILLGLGFPQSMLRFIPQYRTTKDGARLRGLIRSSQRLTLAISVAIASIGSVVALTVVAPGRHDASAVTLVALWLVPVGALINLDSAIIRAGGRIVGAYAPALVLRPLAILLISGACWLEWGRLTAVTVLLITIGVYVVVTALQAFFVHEVLRDGEPAKAAIYDKRVWLRVSVPLLLVAGFQLALSQADLLIVGATRGVRDAAFYQAASKTAMLVSYLLVAVNAIAAPLFSELEAKKDRVTLQRFVALSTQWVFWPTLFIAAGLALLAPYVLGLFGPHFVTARGALLVLLLGQLVNAACGSVGYLLSMTGHQDDTAKVYGITSVVNVCLCYASTRVFGLVGAASATTVSMVVWNVWLYRLTRKRLGIRASALAFFARADADTRQPSETSAFDRSAPHGMSHLALSAVNAQGSVVGNNNDVSG